MKFIALVKKTLRICQEKILVRKSYKFLVTIAQI